MNTKKWYQQKSFWSGAAIVLTGVLGFLTDVLTPEQATAVMTIFAGLTAIFLRAAIETAAKAVEETKIIAKQTSKTVSADKTIVEDVREIVEDIKNIKEKN